MYKKALIILNRDKNYLKINTGSILPISIVISTNSLVPISKNKVLLEQIYTS